MKNIDNTMMQRRITNKSAFWSLDIGFELMSGTCSKKDEGIGKWACELDTLLFCLLVWRLESKWNYNKHKALVSIECIDRLVYWELGNTASKQRLLTDCSVETVSTIVYGLGDHVPDVLLAWATPPCA